MSCDHLSSKPPSFTGVIGYTVICVKIDSDLAGWWESHGIEIVISDKSLTLTNLTSKPTNIVREYDHVSQFEDHLPTVVLSNKSAPIVLCRRPS